MVQLDTRLPLMVQSPDVVNALNTGTVAAGNQANLMRQAEGQNLFRQYGAGAMRGDPEAMNALAGFDPVMAQNMQMTRNQDRRAEASLGMQRERLQMARDEIARGLAQAEDQAAAAREAQEAVRLGNQAFAAWQAGDEQRWRQITGLIGMDLPMTEEGVAALGAVVQGASAYEAWRAARPQQPSANDRYKTVGGQLVDLYADGGPAPVPGVEGRTAGMSLTVNPEGGFTLTEGGPMVMDRANLQSGSGQVRIADPDSPTQTRIVAEPGSDAALEAEGRANKEREQRLKLGTTLTSLNMNIAEIEDGGPPVAGPWGEARRTWLGRALTGNDAFDFGNRSEQITDAAAFDEIQRMRDNSPTGGAVGQLTDDERRAIGNAVTALNVASSEAEYLRAAKAYRKLALDLAYGEGRWTLDADGQVTAKSAADFSQMGMNDLLMVDIDSLPIEQVDAYLRRLNEVQGQ